MSSSSSSAEPSLSDILTEIKILEALVKVLQDKIIAVSAQCLSIHDVLQSDDATEFDLDMDDGSEDEEPSRVRVGSLARSNAGLSSAAAATPTAVAASSVANASTGGATHTPSTEKPCPPPKALYRFR